MWRLPRLPLVFWLVRALVHIMIFLLIDVALDMAQVLGLILIFLCYLGGIDSNGWLTSFLSFFLMFLRVGSLGLRLISERRRIIGISLFFIPIRSLVVLLLIGVVFVLFDQRLIFFWISEIDFPSPERWLKAGLCFYINSFFYHFVPRFQILPLIV